MPSIVRRLVHDRPCWVVRGGGSLAAMFDHVGIRVSDLGAHPSASTGTVLSVFGVEPSHATASWWSWEEWAMEPDRSRASCDPRPARRHPRADRANVDAFWRAGTEAGHPDDGAPGPRAISAPTTTARSCSIPTATASRRSTDSERARARRRHRPPVDPRPRPRAPAFYETVAPYAGPALGARHPDRVQFRAPAARSRWCASSAR